jgi:hypothetical protein
MAAGAGGGVIGGFFGVGGAFSYAMKARVELLAGASVVFKRIALNYKAVYEPSLKAWAKARSGLTGKEGKSDHLRNYSATPKASGGALNFSLSPTVVR